ncbi:Cytochrome b-c1 complex subunit Rieske, mitochondrial [Schizosaccharomyces pombe]|uniref:Cytochrome b-c1 complex subunit Rieske, mitochondrial n=1 Tax=Schizosaccharomyces pombe (strain 972 / ATCC 24843) TaxID=284812 RepID=UCRI_SCHPO|nr:ubiquinol-cytochrome-c reductase complex subunit 5 [Schizosaccharomyces pombe]Q09154.2 RecName: Full=Cytochrome b-c1 complex subunit Rieske, mitochondrial; AltName: Full=Complex III subunit 5; AltName: Full=Rieske iron-sulfur protein; Short=RISP; AltName: Full=Ubiquinol-cytochrome c reductase iron-sulfur subunit; Flags: Precursor [Schizosaccharomyces pombe 972h-]8Q1B_E Chain E, Cytochrome b-c1 complex subunit Rieske, mitochondrial [Schizosaccharomyces pombe]8Q1B_P Chain P, Cytochrome b-c1 com|eukprot:NP_595941.1 ubiquinol-cytochrome-c reductase complex subunit 5 [Schizosaccharomyces pombe]
MLAKQFISKSLASSLRRLLPVSSTASSLKGSMMTIPKFTSIRTYTDSPEMPDFSEYQTKSTGDRSRVISYAMVGTMGALTAAGAQATVHDFLASWSASADVLAMSKAEVDLSKIPEGKNLVVKWQGKPVFIRHRTPEEIQEANSVDISTLRDPQADSDRVQKPEWLVMIGVCTHLGCVPIGEAGDYGGWFCPCHGSHYDISGRIRRGPAPLNLAIPAYTFEGSKIIIG